MKDENVPTFFNTRKVNIAYTWPREPGEISQASFYFRIAAGKQTKQKSKDQVRKVRQRRLQGLKEKGSLFSHGTPTILL